MPGKDLLGLRFGRLLVTAQAPHIAHYRAWHVRCDCGKTFVTRAGYLLSGSTQSCGCLRKDMLSAMAKRTSIRHGFCVGGHKRWYTIWRGMLGRCYNAKVRAYPRYGGAGITVCERWHDPANFIADMGEPPDGTSLDRIDSSLGYSPENCRWATVEMQGQNRRGVHWIEFNGVRDTAAGWARRVGVSAGVMRERLDRWPLNRALTEPSRQGRRLCPD